MKSLELVSDYQFFVRGLLFPGLEFLLEGFLLFRAHGVPLHCPIIQMVLFFR